MQTFLMILWLASLIGWRWKLRHTEGWAHTVGAWVVRPLIWGVPICAPVVDALNPLSAIEFGWVAGVSTILIGRYFGWVDANPDQGDGQRDVLTDSAAMAALAQGFDPLPYIQKACAGEVFFGLGDDKKRSPIYLPAQVFSKNHLEILGESGVGKSSLAGVLLTQFAKNGETVLVFDPKSDRNLPGALAKAGKKFGFPVTLIDLRFQAPPQLNPFLHCRRDQVEELLQVALELGKTGDGGVDFYRGKDREATGWLAQAFADGETSMPELVRVGGEDERVIEQENLWRELRQIARVPAFGVEQGEPGLDFPALLQQPGVIYVYGSTTRLEVQAAQKLLLQRALQVIDERQDQDTPVALFLDELKYLLSPASLRAAGTIRDRNCHLMFAHQSLQDLADCPGLAKEAVKGAIWGNSGIKVVYKMLDSTTGKELSLIAGQKATWEVRHGANSQGESTSSGWGKQDYMPLHTFTHLPKPISGEASVGVVFGLGPAFFLSTRWLESGPPPTVQAAPKPAPRPHVERDYREKEILEHSVPPTVHVVDQQQADEMSGMLDDLMSEPEPAQEAVSGAVSNKFSDEV